MVNVNKKYLEPKLKRRAWDGLLKQTQKANSPDDLEKIINKWLTPKELVMLEKRLAIKVLLKQGAHHNNIKRILDVSSHTITGVKRKLS